MKYLLIIFIPLYSYAQEYKVTHRGHPYTVNFAIDGVSLKNKKVNLFLNREDCSEKIIDSLKEDFLSSLRKRVQESAYTIEVSSGKEKFFIIKNSNEGKILLNYPDRVIKNILIAKETCTTKTSGPLKGK